MKTKFYHLAVPETGSPQGSFWDKMRMKMAARGEGAKLEACFQRARNRRAGVISLSIPATLADQVAGRVSALLAVEHDASDLVNGALQTARGAR